MANWRKAWFEFVATIRRKLARKEKRDVTHREAMKAASELWPKEKVRLMNRIKREEKRAARDAKTKEADAPQPGV